MNGLKRLVRAALTLALMGTLCLSAAAAGNVTYTGDAGRFVFQPGSDLSVTDLFSDFKNVMPGDTLTQTVTVRSNASQKVSVKLYLRALGAHDEQSRQFLSQLTLTVRAGESELFHSAADQTAQLTDWVELGQLGPGGTAQLTVTLQVPVTLDNRFMDAVGYLDWEFMVEEIPVDDPDQPGGPGQPGGPDDPDQPGQPGGPDDPDQPGQPDDPDQPDQPDQPQKPDVPKTGDQVNIGLYAALFAAAGIVMALLIWLLLRKKEKKKDH